MKTVGSHLATLLSGSGTLRRQFAPFVKYVAVLVAVVLLYGWLFHVIMALEGQEHSWFTGIYWALTVMSTLGFGDITFHSAVAACDDATGPDGARRIADRRARCPGGAVSSWRPASSRRCRP